MSHRKMDGGSDGVEAERCVAAAQKLLSTHDLNGAKTFAIRARGSDPRLAEFSNQIIAVADLLLASQLRVDANQNSYRDYYAILKLRRFTQSMETIATQYRNLALLLNPTRNKLPLVDQAFGLVCEAWMVLSNPQKKAQYDHDLQLSEMSHLGQSATASSGSALMGSEATEGKRVDCTGSIPNLNSKASKAEMCGRDVNLSNTWPAADMTTEPKGTDSSRTSVEQSTHSPTPVMPPQQSRPTVAGFWTACPYCYIFYEYPQQYEGCAIRCQKCERAFHAATIPSPPITGNDAGFCCWAFFPLGYSGGESDVGHLGCSWPPFSVMFNNPLHGGNEMGDHQKSKQNNNRSQSFKQNVVSNDDADTDVPESSDEDKSDSDRDWADTKKRKRYKNANMRKPRSKNVRKTQNLGASGDANAATMKKVDENPPKTKTGKDVGKLDLNVMFSNEGEEVVQGVNGGHGNRTGKAEEENVAGIGFFEGLDEFLSTLPILSVDGDDKVKAHQ